MGCLQTAIDLAAKKANIQKPVIDYYQEDSGNLLKLLLGVKTNINGINLPPDLTAGEGLIIQDILGNTYPRYLYR